MLVIIKSGPDTTEGKRGVKTAGDMAADIALLQNAVYFAQKDRMGGFCGTIHVLAEDCRLRGLGETDIEGGIKQIGYDELVDLMVKDEKVIGVL
jgi:sulfur relay protein TusB/DsrH